MTNQPKIIPFKSAGDVALTQLKRQSMEEKIRRDAELRAKVDEWWEKTRGLTQMEGEAND